MPSLRRSTTYSQATAGMTTSILAILISTTSNSLSGFLSTLVPVAAEAALFFGIFLLMRTKKQRVYRPRTYLSTLRDQEKSEPLPEGKTNWFGSFKRIPDEYVLNHQSLDGYLYLRFLKMLTIICFVGCCLTFPVLFPVNATGGGGQQQLDILSFSNINQNGKNRYYAHVFIGWVFFSFVMGIITRESIYFINLRRAYLLAPFNASRISSRTVLFTDVPAEYQNKEKLRVLFGGAMRRSWLATDCKDLTDKVEERDKDALKLEGAEIKLIQKANKRRMKWEKKNEKTKKSPSADGEDAEIATPGSRWLEKKDRPTHRLGKIPLIGKKVDTIEWSRTELRRLVSEVEKDQAAHVHFEGKLIPAVFIEFNTQQAAEAAFRRMAPRKSPHMNPRAISVTPDEVVWKNLKINKIERRGRKIATTTFIVLMIIFWAIPVAIISAISNINYLTQQVTFLSFINNIPKVILGMVTGLLPSVLLAVLMALVPIVCRWMAKLSGEVTLPAVELKTQSWYMAFQVIQVFLVTTFSSGAASSAAQIVSNPSSATTLLVENLPKASNFYISYFILQGLGIAAGDILNIGALAMLTVVGKFLDKSPRKMFKRFITLSGLGWGSMYPKFGNLGIIAITYSIIAPLVLGFATIGFALIYLAVRYNSFYALQQLMTGIYLSEVCLIGLFAINTAPGPIVLMAVFLGATIIYHLFMRRALKPLMLYLPDDLETEDHTSMFSKSDHKSYDAAKAGVPPSEAQPVAVNRLSAKKAGFFGRIFDVRKFKSFNKAKSIIPNSKPPQYEAEEAEQAYFDPAITSPTPKLWIARDEMGISRKEVMDTRDVVPISDEFAWFNEKGKIVWDEERVLDVPVWQRRFDY
ncbi:DUF221-domain-containing protein [Hyaloscypha variabilis F]|uniref:DUF221-domain-containing protein n=1 Tax=Hyaloscypha variabilis (strain UAMH 11265 / GT02V1 / F) TaxID=1149755 RepID=A0A2J6QUS6_HYAVF|nr:DUF221-domain-containing protein [Hyaloscypha variabilis F]